MQPNATLLDLLLELQALDRVPRSGYVLRGVAEPESVTEHSWHVLFLVWSLGARIPGIDVARAVEIALVHDLAELRIGDLPRTSAHYFPAGAKREAEAAAMADVLAPLPARARELYAEYQAAATPEARLVQVLDARGRVVTARTRPGLLGHRATLDPSGEPLVDGRPWRSAEVARDVLAAAGPGAHLADGGAPRRFDVLPLLVATDGSIAAF